MTYRSFYQELEIQVKLGEANLMSNIKPVMDKFREKMHSFDWAAPAVGQPAIDQVHRSRVEALHVDLQKLLKSGGFSLVQVEQLISGFLQTVELTTCYELYRNGQLMRHRYK